MMIIFQGYLFGRSEFKTGELMPAIDSRDGCLECTDAINRVSTLGN